MSFKRWVWTFICLIFATRFLFLNWGNQNYFHPDENNMATAVSRLSLLDLNPHFFAYGQFPLYLTFFSLYPFVGDQPPFALSVLILRFWSAIFSSLALYYFYKIGGPIFLLLLIFSPGLIQIAHFGTTESILLAVFAANLYYLLKIWSKPQLKYFLFAAIFSAIGIGSKVTSLFFIWPIFLVGLYRRRYLDTLIFSSLTLLLFFLFSPHNWISFNDFISAFNYESAVAGGSLEVFYTRQFLGKTNYLFQLTNIFPYVSGLPVFIFSIFGLVKFIKDKKNISVNIILIPSLVYFIYFGGLFVKWTRFMSPIFFIFPLLASYFLISLKKYQKLFIFICCLPGLIFFLNYFLPDTRTQATNWINQNIKNSTIITESGNVTDLSIFNNNLINFDFYDLDFNDANRQKLISNISQSDYILVPSRRIFKNQTKPLFPVSGNYYQALFNGQLGFILEKEFKPFEIMTSENAEETFTVFDRPTLRLYKKIRQLSIEEIESLILNLNF
jgi:hypothetical protein